MTKSAYPDPWMLAHLLPTSLAPPARLSPRGVVSAPKTKEILLAF